MLMTCCCVTAVIVVTTWTACHQRWMLCLRGIVSVVNAHPPSYSLAQKPRPRRSRRLCQKRAILMLKTSSQFLANLLQDRLPYSVSLPACVVSSIAVLAMLTRLCVEVNCLHAVCPAVHQVHMESLERPAVWTASCVSVVGLALSRTDLDLTSKTRG